MRRAVAELLPGGVGLDPGRGFVADAIQDISLHKLRIQGMQPPAAGVVIRAHVQKRVELIGEAAWLYAHAKNFALGVGDALAGNLPGDE